MRVSACHSRGLRCRWVPITFGVEWAHWSGAGREETEAAGELWPDPFACQGLPWIPECRELGLSVVVGAGAGILREEGDVSVSSRLFLGDLVVP